MTFASKPGQDSYRATFEAVHILARSGVGPVVFACHAPAYSKTVPESGKDTFPVLLLDALTRGERARPRRLLRQEPRGLVDKSRGPRHLRSSGLFHLCAKRGNAQVAVTLIDCPVPGEAIHALCGEVVSSSRGVRRARFDLALALIDAERSDAAVRELREALKEAGDDPPEWRIHLELGLLAERVGDQPVEAFSELVSAATGAPPPDADDPSAAALQMLESTSGRWLASKIDDFPKCAHSSSKPGGMTPTRDSYAWRPRRPSCEVMPRQRSR